MVNWKNIHKDFENNPRLISEWEEFGFSPLEGKEWIEAGLEPQDAKYAFWLKEVSEESDSRTHRIDNKNSTGLIDNKDKEGLHLKISEIKEEKRSGIVIQSLAKLLRNKNKLIEELKSDKKTLKEYQWEKIGKGNRLVDSKEQKDKEMVQQSTEIYLLEKKNQELQQLLMQQEHSQHRIKELNKQLIDRELELKRLSQENEELRKFSSNSQKNSLVDNNSEVFELLWRKCEELERENQTLREKLKTVKWKELERLKSSIKIKLDEDLHEELDDLLEAQMEFTKNNNNSYAERQLGKVKSKLIKRGNLTEQELASICEIQKELAKLEIEVENKLEARVEVL